MKKSILAVCDREREYANALVDYLQIRKAVPYEVHGFTDVELLLDFLKENKTEILMISETDMCEAVKEIPIGRIYILTEYNCPFEGENIIRISKFQTAENLFREVMSYYAQSEDVYQSRYITQNKMQMIGIYSPVKRSLKTSFALTLGQVLSTTRRTLYINLEDYAGFQSLMRRTYTTDMSDLLYYISQKKPNFIWKLASIVQRIGDLDYIPPALASVDIRSITLDMWMAFFRELRNCDYEIVILDLGDSVDGIYEILRACTRVYTPTRDDAISYAKMEQYEALLRAMEYEDVLERTRKLSFSYFQGVEKGFDQLVLSDLGKYVRKLLLTEEF